MIRSFSKQENPKDESEGKKNEKRKLRFGRSLMSRYIILILCAVLFVPVVLPITSVIYVVVVNNVSKGNAAPYGDVTHISNLWSNESKKLDQATPAKIDDRMKQLHAQYPKSSVYRVDENGKTAFILGGEGVEVVETPANGSTLTTLNWPLNDQKKVETRIPAVWDASYTMEFMKEAVYRDPLTVVSFVGGGNQDKGKGFMVIEVPRYLLQKSQSNWPMELLYLGLLMTIIFLFFIVMSILFLHGFANG